MESSARRVEDAKRIEAAALAQSEAANTAVKRANDSVAALQRELADVKAQRAAAVNAKDEAEKLATADRKAVSACEIVRGLVVLV